VKAKKDESTALFTHTAIERAFFLTCLIIPLQQLPEPGHFVEE
jgi:hypothetical protein